VAIVGTIAPATFIVKPYRIPSPAMVRTLELGDRLLVNPGARELSIDDGHMVLNGKRQAEPFSTEPCGDGPECDLPREIAVPPDDWFMMGDDRGASDDSRFRGPGPTDAIVGRAFFRYWPSGRVGGL
jgi:signal peptidase I